MENGTTILFGLPGVAVQRVERVRDEHGDAVRLVHVVTTASSAAGCPQCGVVSVSVKQRRTTRPRDLPYGEEPLAVRWRKRQYRCQEAACPRKAFTESIAEIPARARLTGRLCRQLASQVASGRSVAAVAAQYQVSWPVTHRRYAIHADALLTEPEPPVVLGIDETRRGRPKWLQDPVTGRWVRTERFETNFTDLSGAGRLLGQVAGRTGAAVTGWLDERGQDWKNQVKFVATGAVRGLPVRRHQGAAGRGHRGRSLPPGPPRQPGRHHSPAAGHPPGAGPARYQQGSGMGEPAAAAARPRAAVRPVLLADADRDPRPGANRRAARHVDRQGRTPLPARPRPQPPGQVAGQQQAVRVLRLVRPRRRSRGHHPGQDHRSVVAADPRLHSDRHHQRRHRSEQPAHQRRRPDRLRVPQPRQPAAQSTVALQTNNDHQSAVARVTSPLKIEEPR